MAQVVSLFIVRKIVYKRQNIMILTLSGFEKIHSKLQWNALMIDWWFWTYISWIGAISCSSKLEILKLAITHVY